jgi:enoyl-[acyl-carrier protein] reductase II
MITSLFHIEKPIVQAGMVWVSGWRLASAVSNAGGLGLIGAGSMHPEVLRLHIRRCQAATDQPFGVNVPLLYPGIREVLDILAEENVRIVFTSAGNPAAYTAELKDLGMTVVHVVSSTRFAVKAQAAGCDAVVAEGFEAGGHNGREETTTMVLVPAVKQAVDVPVIAAGGIASGRQMLAAIALGADGVQVGSAFVCAEESSAHDRFKQAVVQAGEGDTLLTLKKTVPVRLLRNAFFQQVQELEAQGAPAEALQALLGKGRAKLGMFEGNLEEGELEIGQVSASIRSVQPAAVILHNLYSDYLAARQALAGHPATGACTSGSGPGSGPGE